MKGSLQDMAVADLIQLTCQDRKAVHVELRSGGQKAALFFKNGNLVHAQLDDLNGEDAVYKLLGWNEGSFELKQDVEPPDVSITREWTSLLLEGARRIDEGIVRTNGSGQDTELAKLMAAGIAPGQLYAEMDKDFASLWGIETGDWMRAGASKLQNLMTDLGQEVEAFMGASIATIRGRLLVHAVFADLDMADLVPRISPFVKTVSNAAAKLGAGKMEDNLLKTSKAYLVTRMLKGSASYLMIVVDKETANLGNLRHMCKVYAERISKLGIEKAVTRLDS
ncbi:MAG: DUF4388 domain-containing protein [Anaerolineales bacterium]